VRAVERRRAKNIAVLPSVLREVSRESFLVPFVMGPDLSGVFGGMSLPPTPHRFPGLLRIAFDPVASVLASTFGILIWHGLGVPGEPTRSNRTQQKSAVPRAAPLLRGNDSNVRPSGYEPDELPLLHPANQFYLYRDPKKYANHRATLVGPSLTVRANASLACPSRCTAMIDSFGPMYP
jgi:hypothetical protein